MRPGSQCMVLVLRVRARNADGFFGDTSGRGCRREDRQRSTRDCIW